MQERRPDEAVGVGHHKTHSRPPGQARRKGVTRRPCEDHFDLNFIHCITSTVATLLWPARASRSVCRLPRGETSACAPVPSVFQSMVQWLSVLWPKLAQRRFRNRGGWLRELARIGWV